MLKRASMVAGLLAAVPLVLASCGDEEATDEAFVADICKANARLQDDLGKAIQDASTQTDSAKAIERLIPPIEAYVKAFKDADPPKDLEDWHDDAVEQLEGTLDAFKSEKTLASLQGFSDSPVPDPPAEAKTRLREVAAKVDACSGVPFLKPD